MSNADKYYLCPRCLETAKPEQDICRSCLNIYSPEYITQIVDSIKNLIQTSNYSFKTFAFCLSFPRSLMVRSYLFARDKKTDRHYIKETFKDVFVPEIRNALNVDFERHANFQIAIEFFFEDPVFESDEMSNVDRINSSMAGNSRLSVDEIYEFLKRLNVSKHKNQYNYLLQRYSFKPRVPLLFKISLASKSVFIGGRYNKLQRNISQTPWLNSDTQKNDEDCVGAYNTISIYEIIERSLRHNNIKYGRMKFSSAGREDIDVKMLGEGRPFSIELINPCVTDNEYYANETLLNNICEHVNSFHIPPFKKNKPLIRISQLKVMNTEDLKQLHEGQETHTKTYIAKIIFEHALSEEQLDNMNSIRNLTIVQKTPLRVLRRRSVIDREKTVHDMHLFHLYGTVYQLTLTTQAGTYIKEFVHGDMKRTRPSVAEITGVDCDIIHLDVLGIGEKK